MHRGPLRSRKYRDGSRGQHCKLRIAGVCEDNRETTVFCHFPDRHYGKSQKASDTSGADGCQRCHDVMDRRVKMPNGDLISREDWLFYALRGIQETLEDRVARGIVVVPLDPERLSSDRTVPKRKPKSERKAIPARANPWPKGRKIASRPLVRKSERTAT